MINSIGGVESWLYYISRLVKDYDITVLYKSGDTKQIKRLSKNIRCIKWDGFETFKCKKLFVNYNPEILGKVSADETYFFIHSDYKSLTAKGQLPKAYPRNIAGDKRIDHFVAVSKLAAQSFFEITGVMPEICYNPIVLDEPKKMIRLCSAQRMTSEKGGERIKKLISALDKYCYNNDCEFRYDIYTTDPKLNISNSVYYYPPTLDVNRLFGYYDYFVALSDNEGYCYSVVEALCRGTPCVVTPCPVFDELGLNETNSIRLNFDCSNIDEVIDKMFNKKFKKFKYTPPATTFETLIAKDPTTYTVEEKERSQVEYLKVKPIRKFYDIVTGQLHNVGDAPFEADISRAQYLSGKGLVVIIDDRS